MTDSYLGVKQILAWPQRKPNSSEEGYAVKYSDGYISWSPKDVFEAAYAPMHEEFEAQDPTRINQAMVERMVKHIVVTRMDNTTVVHATLVTGFTLTETSACVDAENYDEEIGIELAMQKIYKQIWFAMGFLLAWARNGLQAVRPSKETDGSPYMNLEPEPAVPTDPVVPVVDDTVSFDSSD